MRRAILLLLLFTTPAFAKSLYWRSIDVNARVEADGRVHVRERQTIVFDGDWNGGERTFVLKPQQRLDVNGVTRIDGATVVELEQGVLDDVDRWSRVDDAVRWRSRLPSDPPFAQKELTYELDFTYRNVLVSRGGKGFVLDHDFGMSDRSGVIERFALNVEFDPSWNAAPIHLTRENLPPGVNVPVVQDLTYKGDWPAGVDKPIPAWIPPAAIALLAVGAVILYVLFVREEQEVGRFAPVEPRFDSDMQLIEPELAGAIWDAGVGAPEVAAVLARMAQEEKLWTQADGKKLRMRLLVDRSTLHGYERELIDALFTSTSDETDTDEVKDRYRSTGFDPAGKIKPGIESKLSQMPDWDEKRKRFSGWLNTFLMLGAIALLAFSVSDHDSDIFIGVMGFIVAFIFCLIATIIAGNLSASVTSMRRAIAWPLAFWIIGCVPLLLAAVFARPFGLHAPVLFALTLLLLAWLKLIFDVLRIRDTPSKIAYRKRVAGARAFFIEQLELPDPKLRDAWFPYVLAFGLGKNVDRWFRAHGGTTSSSWSHTSSSSSSSSSVSSSSGGSSWTGGGGAFGGAGATGSWALAAGAMASGVAAPSSSSSGSSGGGSSSSGGGGGGGW